jgi:hypothetical protein
MAIEFEFSKLQVYNKTRIEGRFEDGDDIVLIKQGSGSISLRKKKAADGDLYSHPHPEYASDSPHADAAVYQDFIQTLLSIKQYQDISRDLRAYILELIINPTMLAQFLADPDAALDVVEAAPGEKQMLKDAAAGLQAKIEDFRPGNVIDDGDHFLLFPQSTAVDDIAPKAWFDAAWSFIAHFRSNFGMYLGEARLYSQVTVLGSTDVKPAVSAGEQAFLARDDWRAVERIEISSAKDLARVLDWGRAHDKNFGLGRVTPLILGRVSDEEILSQLEPPLDRVFSA